MRQQQSHRRRDRHLPDEQPMARCRPTLHATFVNGQLVAVEHRHVARTQPSAGPPPAREGATARGLTSPARFDPGCSGPCEGRRDRLPLAYLLGGDKNGA